MRFAQLIPINDSVAEIQKLYGSFDIGPDGRPTTSWERRHIRLQRLGAPLRHAFFPDVWLYKVAVNRRAAGALAQVFSELQARFTPEALEAHGLNQFVKCYCFGDGTSPSPFWYGAGWRLSEQVGGETLLEAAKVFTKHGFTHAYASDKKRVRDFEFW